jgi:hypothetical protein
MAKSMMMSASELGGESAERATIVISHEENVMEAVHAGIAQVSAFTAYTHHFDSPV